MTPLFSIIALTLLGSILSLVGGVIFLYRSELTNRLEAVAIPFAAGVLLTVSLFGIIPESIEHVGALTYGVTAVTFLIAYVLERHVLDIHHHAHETHSHPYEAAGWMVMIGDTIHNFVDGAAIAGSFFVAPGLGLITAVSTFLHEVPHEIGDFGVLLRAGWSKKSIIAGNALSATASLFGAVLVYMIPLSDTFIGTLLSISAGLFLYLGIADFLPHILKQKNTETIAPFIVGIGIMAVLLALIPHV